MYLYMLFLLLSLRACSCFLPLKEKPFLQNKTISTIIDEMLCLLEAEKESLKMEFSTPTHVKNKTCADSDTEKFIKGLEKIHNHVCMKRVKAGMERLRENCPSLKKSLHHDKRCSEMKTDFHRFKETLENFLRWINHNMVCKKVVITEPDLYTDDKCTCHDPQKYRKGSL
uniref:IL7 protein n=1 Tax=Dromaius novaehollandiae TaxID=8790 RepID=A0A8C4JU93_DRONO